MNASMITARRRLMAKNEQTKIMAQQNIDANGVEESIRLYMIMDQESFVTI
jgi:hypothetical protein